MKYLAVADTNVRLGFVDQAEFERDRRRSKMYKRILGSRGVLLPNNQFPGVVASRLDDRCFDAAYGEAVKHGLFYFEGLAVIRVRPSELTRSTTFGYPHGYCVDREGVIHDPTMHNLSGSPSVVYLGVPIRKDYAKRWRDETGYYGCLDGLPGNSKAGVYVDPVDQWWDSDFQTPKALAWF